MRFDYVIIGAGVAGLTAGAYLSGRGFSVAVLEKAPRPGPVLSGFVREGLRFDTGLHLTGGLADGEILHSYLKMLGVDQDLERVFLRPDAAEQIIFEGSDQPPLALPTGFPAFRAALSAHFPQETQAIDRYIADVRRAMDSSSFLNPKQEAPHGLPAETAFSDVSLNDTLNALTRDPRLRLVFFLRCSLHGTLPKETPFHNHALVDGSLRGSLGSFSGGGHAFVTALARKITANGGSIRTNCPAEEILRDNGVVCGVRAGGDLFATGRCIYTGHPALLPELVPPDAFRGVYGRRLRALPETVSCCMLFAVADLPCELEDKALYLCPGTDPEDLLSGDDPRRSLIFLSAAPRRKGEDRLALTAVMPCRLDRFAPFAKSRRGGRPGPYTEAKSALIAVMKQRILAALPSLQGRLRVVEGATPLTLADYAHNPRGGTYGVRQTVNELPLLPRTRLAGLFLAGQSVLLPGILGGMVSALLACGLSADWATLQKELRQWHGRV